MMMIFFSISVFQFILSSFSPTSQKNLGEIELEHLPLKRDLIRYLGLPLEANTGWLFDFFSSISQYFNLKLFFSSQIQIKNAKVLLEKFR